LFEIFITDQAKQQLKRLKTDRGLAKRYKAVKKAIRFLSENPRHKSLKTHEFTSLKGPHGVRRSSRLMQNNQPLPHTESSGTMDLKRTK
jgi:hypothetical protein